MLVNHTINLLLLLLQIFTKPQGNPSCFGPFSFTIEILYVIVFQKGLFGSKFLPIKQKECLRISTKQAFAKVYIKRSKHAVSFKINVYDTYKRRHNIKY